MLVEDFVREVWEACRMVAAGSEKSLQARLRIDFTAAPRGKKRKFEAVVREGDALEYSDKWFEEFIDMYATRIYSGSYWPLSMNVDFMLGRRPVIWPCSARFSVHWHSRRYWYQGHGYRREPSAYMRRGGRDDWSQVLNPLMRLACRCPWRDRVFTDPPAWMASLLYVACANMVGAARLETAARFVQTAWPEEGWTVNEAIRQYWEICRTAAAVMQVALPSVLALNREARTMKEDTA